MASFEAGDIATWVSAAVAVVAMTWSIRASREANRYQQEAAALTKRNAEILEKQRQLELRSWTEQYFAAVRAWADQVCCAISEAIHIVDDKSSDNRKFEVLVRLSALLDTGRWYFPNQWDDKVGLRKHPAYRGVRQPVLECVFTAYRLLKTEAEADRAKDLVSAQRNFVSFIQSVLDPRTREQEIRKILKEFEESERIRNAP